jgi:hypothetical protein
VNCFPGFLFHFEVAHQMDDILKQGPRKGDLGVAFHGFLDLRDGQLRR